ncbi:uncharacterized protein CC84DRAFT_854266 [Paraphaeosphaeria sporulosa]|uniref:Uncharacterized protein n=1 Tax=Paraphaeosphaeria sporulosa TaxID=1460663 RepID=A0A177C9T6_9PLEO|nr:uncharacterized protein CC84DRAFT_854266 [Paraphaeosphaeria sporulosa]OAG03517.1 hypothetical protein CC84DRAFT_854266 [Paraphaeosphaeria sporulosa]
MYAYSRSVHSSRPSTISVQLGQSVCKPTGIYPVSPRIEGAPSVFLVPGGILMMFFVRVMLGRCCWSRAFVALRPSLRLVWQARSHLYSKTGSCKRVECSR